LSRRAAIQWIVTAGAAVSVLEWRAFAAPPATATGYGTDPVLTDSYNPGDLWPLTLTDPQRRVASALCDVIIPADGKSPAASAVHVVDFIDEWISAPYPAQQAQRGTILDGLTWLEQEAKRRFKASFASLTTAQQQAICDDICHLPMAAPAFKDASVFFAAFRDLTASGYYTTKTGWDDIGYVGNVPLAKYEGPPPEVLKYLGLT
jgi:hypothetical protein